MIKIDEINNDLIEKYYNDQKRAFSKLIGTLSKSSPKKYEKILSYLSTKGIIDNMKIKKLIIGDITELKRAIKEIGVITEPQNTGFHKLYDNFTKRNLGKKWAELIGVKVCPYCNRSYIFTLNKLGIRPQYDHYFPKSKYPYLAVSMYNLVPSCSICNNVKSDFDTFDTVNKLETLIYPYKDEYGFEFVFQTIYNGDFKVWLGASDDFKIEITNKGTKKSIMENKVNATNQILNLTELYMKHKDYVKDIISKTYIYNDVYFQNLFVQFPELFSSVEEAKNLVFLSYIEKEKWGSRVLAKLTHDITIEFK